MPTCRELGIRLIPSCPLGRGFPAGPVRSLAGLGHGGDFRHPLPRFAEPSLQRDLAMVDALRALALRREITYGRTLYRSDRPKTNHPARAIRDPAGKIPRCPA